MKNKRIFCKIAVMLVLACGCTYLLAAFKNVPTHNDKQLVLVSKLTTKTLQVGHLRKLEQNSFTSSQVFDEYFKQLDPGKVFFTAEDIAAFSKDRFRIFELINGGELQFIYDIFQRYLERVTQYRAFVEEQMNKGIDFTADESYRTDRKDVSYCRDDAELRELWRKRLKNDLLYYRLMQKVMNESADKPEVKEEMQKRWFKKTPEDKVRARMHDLYNSISQMDRMDILGTFLTSMAQVYGPHSNYSTPKQEEDFDIQFKLSLSGIGATLTSEDGFIKIVELVPGGPADRDGRLQPEDRIIAVCQEKGDPVDVIDMSVSNAVKLVRGEAGTKVTLTVLPAAKGSAALPEDITITRGKVELKENEAKGEIKTVTASDKSTRRIGVVKLNNFYMDFEGASQGLPDYRSCSRDMKKILQQFAAEKVDAVVLDFRGNSGGSLLEAIAVSGLFITRGPIVQIVDAAGQLTVEKDEDAEISYGGPLVLLVSKFSASSAEIVTGALKDYRRALIVGDSRTYGKGTVLSVSDLSRVFSFINRGFDAGSLTHEVAMFYRVNGETNQVKGVTPDIVLPSFSEEMEVGEVYSDNHLPWNKIAPQNMTAAAFSGYRPLSSDMVEKLAASSAKRIAGQAEFQKLRQDIARFKAVRERKEVSLNEAKRLKEYYDEKAASDRVDAIFDESEKKKKSADKSDQLLKETLNIAAEYAALSQAAEREN